ncbi:hypothetical protein P7K49_040178 [Saguinus oedipus]|uniref:Uncharacterized protein n=1 Tax=Saguinus oedipus TaxID=9490 RepID=A0ABQ9T8J5_SAGOE|nr:hypothetical protein P7K49_040178 [Saguinus oedipus]
MFLGWGVSAGWSTQSLKVRAPRPKAVEWDFSSGFNCLYPQTNQQPQTKRAFTSLLCPLQSERPTEKEKAKMAQTSQTQTSSQAGAAAALEAQPHVVATLRRSSAPQPPTRSTPSQRGFLIASLEIFLSPRAGTLPVFLRAWLSTSPASMSPVELPSASALRFNAQTGTGTHTVSYTPVPDTLTSP